MAIRIKIAAESSGGGVLGIIATHAVVLQDLLTHFNVYNCWS